MTLTDKEITDILNDSEDDYSAHEVARIIESEVEMKLNEILLEAASEIEAIERLIQKNFPDFQHPLLARIREVLA
jgi:uncharacterized protein YqfB (UPF0267 family)